MYTSLKQLCRDLRCTHPRMVWGGYSLTELIYISDWQCPDCGFWGDSTTITYCKNQAEEHQAWRDYLIECWPR